MASVETLFQPAALTSTYGYERSGPQTIHIPTNNYTHFALKLTFPPTGSRANTLQYKRVCEMCVLYNHGYTGLLRK
jgi:hypothetical protein